MKRRNRLAVGLLCAVLAAALILPVSAHGCHGGRSRGHHSGYSRPVQTTVTVCPYEDCTLAGRHYHSRVLYCGYSHDSGVCDNNCRALCPLEDCAQAGRHLHGYTTYCGYDHESGFCDNTCLALCSYEGCAETGRHTHNGVSCCGYDHEGGFCDGSCETAAAHGRGRCGGC